MQAAEAHCLEALRESPPTAAAYCLLGVVLQAIGRVDEARGQFERAVYLDPEHVESLTHLMLAARRAGEFADADRYQRRAEKAQRRAAAAQSPSSGRAAEARTPEGGGR
jgi:chemotaxis protein methyltransferase WspC